MKKLMLAVLAVPSIVLATSIAPHSIQDRARASTRVVLAQVVGQQVVTENGDPRQMRTVTDVIVGSDLRGQGSERIHVTQLGGDMGLWSSHIAGDASFRLGETAILFLHCRTSEQCTLVSLGEGKINLDGDSAFVHDLFTNQWSKRSVKDVITEIKAAGGTR